MSYVGPGHKSGCNHKAMIGHSITTPSNPARCPTCGDLFVVKLTEIVGCSTGRPKPRRATLLVPCNEFGWTCGEEIISE